MLRGLRAGDEVAVAECWRSVEDATFLGAEAVRDQAFTADSNALVVESDPRVEGIEGFAWLRPAWWYGPGMLSLTLVVRRDRWGCDVGRRLYIAIDAVVERRASKADTTGAAKVFTKIRENHTRAKEFARRRGFEPSGSVELPSRLDLAEARTEGLSAAAVRLQAEGIAIVQLRPDHVNDDGFVTALYECLGEAERDSPASQEVHMRGFGEWRSKLTESLIAGREPVWVALRHNRPIGYSSLEVLDAERVENGFTGVATAERGRGIAKALKLETIRWAVDRGYRWMVTSSEAGNAPMLTINQAIGYRELPAIEEWSKRLAESRH